MNEFDKSADIKEEEPSGEADGGIGQRVKLVVKSVGRYIKQHWRGEQTLAWSFWINGYVLPLQLGFMALPVWLLALIAGTAGVFVFLTLAVIFVWTMAIWQMVGTWRSARRYRAENGALSYGGIAQALILVYLATLVSATAFAVTAVVQHHNDFG